MNYENSQRFLTAFVKIENLLRKIVNADKFIPFPDLVDLGEKKEKALTKFSSELKKYSKLRNAIVHERVGDKAIAEPHLDIVKRLEDIYQVLSDPPVVKKRFLCEVLTCGPKDPIGTTLRQMFKKSFSQIPVYSPEGVFIGLLTSYTISRWLAWNLESRTDFLTEEKVETVLEFAESTENYSIISCTSTLFEVIGLFENFVKYGKPLEAIVITQSGKATEKPLGILTQFDLPELYKAVDVRTIH